MNNKIKVILLSILMIVGQSGISYSAPDFQKPGNNSIDFDNVDKKSVEWKYLLNGEELETYPPIYLQGVKKYIPVDIVRNLGANLLISKENRTAYITNNNESFVLKENSKQIYLNNKSYTIGDALPVWKNNTLYVSTNFLIKMGTLISENRFQNKVSVIKGFNNINEIRFNSDNTEDKISFELNSLPVYEEEIGDKYYKLTFLGTSIREKEKLKKKLDSLSSFFVNTEIDDSKIGLVSIKFNTKFNPEIINSYYLEKPSRLIIQFPKIYDTGKREFVMKGLYYSKLHKGEYNGPERINTLEVDTNKDLIAKPIISRDENMNFSLREVRRFGNDYGALALVNGGYFSATNKEPLGLLIINNKIISEPIYNRSALLLKKDGTFDVQNVDIEAFININYAEGNSKKVKINAVNRIPMRNQLVLYTPEFGKSTKNRFPKVEEEKSKVTEKNNTSENNKDLKTPPKDIVDFSEFYLLPSENKITKSDIEMSSIPQNGYVLYAEGSAKRNFENLIKNSTGYEISINYSINKEEIVNALGGGPTLIKNKGIFITAEEEKFRKDITDGKAPRTAVGIFENLKKIILLTVDGRQDDSKGVTLEELAYLLKSYDVEKAINLDGGGSSGMYLNGEIVNIISDPKERKVSTVFAIFKKK